MKSQAIRAEIVPLPQPVSQPDCVHVWIEDGEKCLVGFTAEAHPIIDEWEQPMYCEHCGETTFRWMGFELDIDGDLLSSD
jgi:hypothetical protein